MPYLANQERGFSNVTVQVDRLYEMVFQRSHTIPHPVHSLGVQRVKFVRPTSAESDVFMEHQNPFSDNNHFCFWGESKSV